MTVDYIDAYRTEFGVEPICAVLSEIDPDNCGACGNACPGAADDSANGSPTCKGGKCGADDNNCKWNYGKTRQTAAPLFFIRGGGCLPIGFVGASAGHDNFSFLGRLKDPGSK